MGGVEIAWVAKGLPALLAVAAVATAFMALGGPWGNGGANDTSVYVQSCISRWALWTGQASTQLGTWERREEEPLSLYGVFSREGTNRIASCAEEIDAPRLAQGDWLAAAWALSYMGDARRFDVRHDAPHTTGGGSNDASSGGASEDLSIVLAATPDGLRTLICAPEFTWDCGWAERVVACESRGDPNVVGSEMIDGVYYEFHGLWQVTWGPFDPYANTVEAHIQFAEWQRGERASSPWPVCGGTYP